MPHAHLALLAWPCQSDKSKERTMNVAKRLLGSCAFVNTWNALGEASEMGSSQEMNANDFEIGVSEQEVFTLVQHRRQLLQDFCRGLNNDELRELLEHAIRTTTGELKLQWSGTPDQCLQKSRKTSSLFSFVDSDGMFVVDLQFAAVTYKSSTLQPVPDLIARHSEFYDFYGGKIHCLLYLICHRQQVFVPKGQKLLSYWNGVDAWTNGLVALA